MVETMENNLRNQIDEIYIKKSKEVIFSIIYIIQILGTARYSNRIGKEFLDHSATIKDMLYNEKQFS